VGDEIAALPPLAQLAQQGPFKPTATSWIPVPRTTLRHRRPAKNGGLLVSELAHNVT
jgi:hypothetical protein